MAFGATSIQYQKIWLADFFHGFPHLDLSFEAINSTFDPESVKYREALGFWAGLPVIWCALLWLAFLIFFCLRCCHKSQRKYSKTTCSCLFAGLFLLLGCGGLAVAFYGNAKLQTGVDNFVHAVKTTNKTIRTSLQLLTTLDRIADNVENKGVPALTKAIDDIGNITIHNKIGEFIKQIQTHVNSAKKDISSVRSDADHVNTAKISDTTEEVEYYRWMVTVVVYCVFIFIFVLTFAGLLKKSKWMLILACVMSVGFMLFIWALTSVYLSLAIATGDLCVDPDHFVLSRVNGTVEEDILVAYIKCTEQSKPYQEQILDAQTEVTQAITALNTTVNMSLPFNISGKLLGPVAMVRKDLKFVFGNLSSLTSLVGSCDTIHDEYITAVRGVCNVGLFGIGYLVVFTAMVGMCSALTAFCSALAWPYFGRRRARGQIQSYAPVDDSDPFLPGPPPYTRDYGSIRQPILTDTSGPDIGAGNVHEEDQPVMNTVPVGESPPPAYHPGHFMQQYYNLAPTPTSMVQSSQSTT